MNMNVSRIIVDNGDGVYSDGEVYAKLFDFKTEITGSDARSIGTFGTFDSEDVDKMIDEINDVLEVGTLEYHPDYPGTLIVTY